MTCCAVASHEGMNAYLESPNGLKQSEVAILDQLTRRQGCVSVSGDPSVTAGHKKRASLLAAETNCSVMSVVTMASLVILGGGGASGSRSKTAGLMLRPLKSEPS